MSLHWIHEIIFIYFEIRHFILKKKNVVLCSSKFKKKIKYDICQINYNFLVIFFVTF